jgi:predicted SAM-dependent methyltransferase
VRLDLACGQTPREGYEGVDLYAPEAKYRFDLFKTPWPFDADCVDAIYCSHFIEHIPSRDNDWGQDMLFAFFDECHRILKPGARMIVIWPDHRTVGAYQDPTHRRFIPQETMSYLSAPIRQASGLGHYPVACDFRVYEQGTERDSHFAALVAVK